MYADKYTRAYYASRSPFLWIDRFGIDARADTLLSRLEQTTHTTGLPPSCFRTAELKAHLRRIRNLDFSSGYDINTTYAHAEYLLTKAYVRYVCGQRFGYVRPDLTFNRLEKNDTTEKASFRTLYDITTETADDAFLQSSMAVLQSGDFEDFFLEIAPRNKLYRQLTEIYGHTQEVAGSLSHPTGKNRKSLRGKPGENAAPEKLRAASAVQQISRQRPSVSQQRSMQRMLPVPEVMSGREHPNERRASPMAGTVHRLPAMLPPLSPACH